MRAVIRGLQEVTHLTVGCPAVDHTQVTQMAQTQMAQVIVTTLIVNQKRRRPSKEHSFWLWVARTEGEPGQPAENVKLFNSPEEQGMSAGAAAAIGVAAGAGGVVAAGVAAIPVAANKVDDNDDSSSENQIVSVVPVAFVVGEETLARPIILLLPSGSECLAATRLPPLPRK